MTKLTLANRKGFTLIELLIVMVILGILTTIVGSSFRTSQQKAHDSRRKTDLESLGKALEVYYNDKGNFPPAVGGEMVGCGVGDAEVCDWGGEFTDAAGTVYMTKIPSESSTARNYYYVTEGGQNQSFALYARLENDLDKDIPKNASDSNQYYDGSNCGSSFSGCNYAISSTNTSPEVFHALTDE